MRPVKLSFKGLRSYREQTDIDFSDLNLFAVIGDTGAGKSTIIEALSLALYATKTWKGGGKLESLIADGEPSLNVELTFVAEGRTWTVTRRRARRAGPIDKLASDDGEKVDGKKEVNARIEALVGLDHDQFIRAVVLPQGRFDELLQTTPAERTKVLRSILDLNDVSATKDAVDQLLARWSGEQAKWQAARDQYSTDPAAELAAAERNAKGLEARAEALDHAAEEADRHQAEADRLDGLRRELVSSLDRVPAEASGAIDRLRSLAPTWREQSDTCQSIDVDLDGIADEQGKSSAEASTVLNGFTDRDALVGAASRANALADELPGALERVGDAATALANLGEPPTDVIDPALEEQHAAAARAREAAYEQVTAANSALADASTLVESWQSVLSGESSALERVEAVDREIVDIDRQLTDASAEVEAAAAAAADANASLNRARVADAAATAGSACEPGDDCPVCQQTLPADYRPPTPSGDVEDARAAAEMRGRDRDRAVEARTKLESDRSGLLAKKDAADENLTETRAQQATLVSRGEATGLQLDADTDDEFLEPFRAAAQAAATNASEASAAEQAADELLRKARTELDLARATFAANQKAAQERLDSAERAVDQLVGRLDSLPDAWSHAQVGVPVERAAAVAATLDTAVQQLRTIDSTREQLDQREREAQRQQSMATAAAQATRTEVEGLVQSVAARVAAVGQAHARVCESDTLADLLDGLTPIGSVDIDTDTPADLAEKLDDLSALDSAAQTIVDRLGGASAELDRRRTAQEHELGEILTKVDMSTHADLLTERGSARNANQASASEIKRLQEAADRSSQLEKQLTMVRPFVANLTALSYALRDSQFVGHLVSQREVELLAEASRRLRRISGERFAFASGFRIINVRSGDVREPEALSGGERFQSALALALALVEIASRGGGRLDSVFIDEGFGSLDSGSLDQALDALGAVSGGGKMVALVSHLRAVAEYVDDVIYVTKDETTGSKLTLLTTEQQEALLESSTSAGLTS